MPARSHHVSATSHPMGTCTRYPDDEFALRYVTGNLAERERTAFEEHLCACQACKARVQGPIGSSHARAVPPRRPGTWWIVGGLAASLLVVLAGVSMPPRPAGAGAAPIAREAVPAALLTPAAGPSSAALRVAVLAMVTPPAYVTLPTPGAGDPRFDTAMQFYSRADWPAASRGLAPLTSPQARFYKGVADLMLGDTAGAVSAFEAAGRSGRQPYARESLFYLGKAALQRGDVAAASTWLVSAREAGGGPAGEADRLLAALADLGR